MKKPKIHRFPVSGKNCAPDKIKRFVEYSEYERLRAKYKELWNSYLKLQSQHDYDFWTVKK